MKLPRNCKSSNRRAVVLWLRDELDGVFVRIETPAGGISDWREVAHRYADIYGGFRLKEMVFGFWSWNAEDVVALRIKPPREKD